MKNLNKMLIFVVVLQFSGCMQKVHVPAPFVFNNVDKNVNIMQEEIWEEIPETNSLYLVSNKGRVKSIMSNIILKASNNKDGYLQVNIKYQEQRKTVPVHKLVAICFLSHTPCGHKEVVDHVDGNIKNNNLKNLQLITHRENILKSNINKSSEYDGVSKCKSGKFISQIRIGSKNVRLGRFSCELEAANAYQNKLKEIEPKDIQK